jgi:YVTN family beta-propeller protein
MSALVLVSLLAPALGACQTDGTSSPGGSATSPPVRTEDGSATPVDEAGRVTTGTKPCGILAAAGKVWVSNYGDDDLVSVDPDTLAVSKPTDVGTSPCGLAYGAGSIWVENYGADTVSRVDARTGKAQHTYDVGGAPYDVTFAGGAAWVTNYADGTLSRIDTATGRTTTIRTGGTPIGIAPAAGRVWVGLGGRGIVAVDVTTGRVWKRIKTGGEAGWTAYDDDTVWVNVGEQTWEIDARTGKVTGRYDVGEKPADGSVVAGVVWVPDQGGDLYGIHDGVLTGPWPTGLDNPFVLAGYRGRIWVVDFLGTDVVTFDPAVFD